MEDLVAHDPRCNLERGTPVGRVRPLLIFNVIEMVSPHGESTRAGGTAQITRQRISDGIPILNGIDDSLVAGVANHEANVVLLREPN